MGAVSGAMGVGRRVDRPPWGTATKACPVDAIVSSSTHKASRCDARAARRDRGGDDSRPAEGNIAALLLVFLSLPSLPSLLIIMIVGSYHGDRDSE
jgi:hypothetical protein